jgi:hypothetical protein
MKTLMGSVDERTVSPTCGSSQAEDILKSVLENDRSSEHLDLVPVAAGVWSQL